MKTSTLLTSDAKEVLRKSIRGLRSKLIEQLGDAARGEYRLDVAIEKAKLPEARRCRRERLEAWIDTELRRATGAKGAVRFFTQAVKEAAHTLLNRLVFLRILEHHGLVAPQVVTGGFSSAAYEQEFVHYMGPLGDDDTRGYRHLLSVVFAELAEELPGLFGPVGLTSLFPIPAATLRAVLDVLNDPELASAWGDDTTLGWVYQYWNDPEREALDAKISGGGKIEPHEIASKTQMFTERYMVEWLLHNSLGLTWLCICKKNGWTPDADAVLPVLDARRADWRKKREAGEVALDALMPIESGLEDAWKYYVPQPIPADAVEKAPVSIRDVKLLDPACGSGHFLVIAYGLLARMHEEEARHRGVRWTARENAERIVADNLHGVDIDPRAVQIAAAGLWLRAKLHAPDARLARMNLVAPSFHLATLPKDDAALRALYDELHALGVPRETTEKLVACLKGVDHLGTLLRIDREIAKLVDDTSKDVGPLFAHGAAKERAALEARVAAYLDAHAVEADLGLRLEGEQLAAGLRFIEVVREGRYDVVVGNPPYQGLSKTSQFEYVVKQYPRGKDLYGAFLERGVELARDGGLSALLTMRGWMFLGQFAELREQLVRTHDLRALGDVDRGAFEDVPDEVLATVMSIFRRAAPDAMATAIQPTALDDRSRDSARTSRKRAAVLAQVGRYEFDPKGFKVIQGEPIVYWWSRSFLAKYAAAPKLGETFPARFGLNSGSNVRFLRRPWELARSGVYSRRISEPHGALPEQPWSRYLKGAAGAAWVDPCDDVIRWKANGLEVKALAEMLYGSASRQIRNERCYWQPGVAFTMIGAEFAARAHRFRSVIDSKGSSVYPVRIDETLCFMNREEARVTLSSLNPTVSFQVGDVNRLPIFPVDDASEIFAIVDRAFGEHESHRETSGEFQRPGPTAWRYVQAWAQRSVDRADGAPLPPQEPEYNLPVAEAIVSFCIGVAFGRFGANGEGTLERAPDDALPAGVLFIGPSDELPDSLVQPACARVAAAWEEHGAAILGGRMGSLRDWLRKDFFAYHKDLYENRPIYFPLSSEKRSFVAWTSIHRWDDRTLQTLLADHLNPVLRKLDGEIKDLALGRASSDKKVAAQAEKQFAKAKTLRDELAAFVAAVTECAERGAPPTDASCPPRAADAAFVMDLDDGVMINSAALWPLLAPQWSDPKKWWKQLCLAEGKKDYDWAHLSRRYFPDRVEEKCKKDPSLAVAHGCFWRYHPAKAYAWELRLQDEIRPDFTIDEEGSNEARERFLAEQADEGAALHEKEMQRRARKAAKSADSEEDAAASGERNDGESDSDEEVA